jgi:hypothetical protein
LFRFKTASGSSLNLLINVNCPRWFLFSLAAICWCAEPEPQPAVDAILGAFDRVPIVALGMSHRLQDEADLSLTVIRDPRFAEKVRNIVVECGNPLYQTLMDRYTEGQQVPIQQLRLFWRNTTQPGRCDARQHKELIDAVREVNRRQPRGHRIRVLAGDPPIDWDKARTPADVAPFGEQRDTHFASVVEDQVLAKGQKALLVIGAGHVLRHPISWASSPQPSPPTITMMIESKHPHSTYVITPHDDFGDRNTELEPRLAKFPVPSLIPLGGNWLGELDGGVIFRGKIRRVGSDPAKIEDPFPGWKLKDIADAYLYLGPEASLHQVEFPSESGTDYAREIERRNRLSGGGMRMVPAPPPR